MARMTVAYLGKVQLSDVDISYLNEARKQMDITYFIEISPRYLHGAAIDINEIYPKTGIFKAIDVYPQFARFSKLLDLSKVYVINTCGKRTWVLKSFWTHILLLIRLIKGNYDVIHATWPFNVYEFILFSLNKKILLTVHDPLVHTGGAGIVPMCRRFFTFKLVKQFVILNKAQKKIFIEKNHLQSNQVIDSKLSCYSYLKGLSYNAPVVNDPYILFFGKITPYKGLDYLLPAMVEIHKRVPAIKLVIAGSGRFYFDISDYQELNYIKFINRFVRDDELAGLISYSKFIVCPYTDATQSGVVMSAFAFGKPVVATNVGGLPEMVKDGIFGRIIKEKDVNSIVESVSELLSRQDVLDKYSQNIRNNYLEGSDSWASIVTDLRRNIEKRFGENNK